MLELWQGRDGRRLRLAAYEHAAGCTAQSRGWPKAPTAARRRPAAHGADDPAAAGRRGRGRDGRARPGRARGVRRGGPARPGRATDGRLLTVGDGEVEVAHEALLREWPRLRGWLEEDAQGRRLHRHLRAAAKEWQAGGRDPGELYRGARLASALDWATDHDPELNASERAFLDSSRTASGRAHRRLRMMLAGAACLLVLAVIAALVALNERGNARTQATVADAQRLGAQALAEDDLDRSLLLAREGVALDDSPQTRSNLLAALLKSPAAIGVMQSHGASWSASISAPTAERWRFSMTAGR